MHVLLWNVIYSSLSYVSLFRQLVVVFDVWVQQGAMMIGQRIRRNSLTTLHSLPASSAADSCLQHAGRRQLAVSRRMSVPHGYNVCTLFASLPTVLERCVSDAVLLYVTLFC